MLGRFGAFGDPGEQEGLPEGNTCGLNPKKGKVSQRDEPNKRKIKVDLHPPIVKVKVK